MAQQVKGLALSLQWLSSPLWCGGVGLIPSQELSHDMGTVQKKKKKEHLRDVDRYYRGKNEFFSHVGQGDKDLMKLKTSSAGPPRAFNT